MQGITQAITVTSTISPSVSFPATPPLSLTPPLVSPTPSLTPAAPIVSHTFDFLSGLGASITGLAPYKDGLETVEHFFTVLAIILGGVIAWLAFVRKREGRPAAEL